MIDARQEWTRLLASAYAERGLGQAELAGEIARLSGLECSQQAISAYLSGRRLPGPAKMRALAEVLRVPPLRLLELGDHIQRQRAASRRRGA